MPLRCRFPELAAEIDDKEEPCSNTPLIHPTILQALSGAGHGSRVLVADGHYPVATGSNPAATVVHLNLRRGLVGANDVLETLITAIFVESATVMRSDDDAPIEAHDDHRRILGSDVPFERLERFPFYDAARTDDVAWWWRRATCATMPTCSSPSACAESLAHSSGDGRSPKPLDASGGIAQDGVHKT